MFRKIRNRYITYAFALKDFAKTIYSKKELDYSQGIYILTDTIREFNIRAYSSKKEPEMVAWIEKHSKPNRVMYDIGANIGAYSLIAAANELDVYSFEPAYQNFFQLNNNVTLNKMDCKIKTFPVAFSTETKLEQFNYLEASFGTSKCYYNEENKYHLSDQIKIQKSTMIFSLDDFIHLFKLPIPHMLKIDVDGAEFDILKGAQNTLKNELLVELIVEIDNTLNSIDEITLFLKDFHFTFIEKVNRNKQVYNCIFTKKKA